MASDFRRNDKQVVFGVRIIRSTDGRAVAALLDPSSRRDPALEKRVARIVEHVRRDGDRALLAYARQFDQLTGEIEVPVVVITGDSDTTVSPAIHSRPFAATVQNAKLIVLAGIGHMVQYAAPELVVREIEAMAADLSTAKAAMR